MAKILYISFSILLLCGCNVDSLQPSAVINTGSLNEFNSIESVEYTHTASKSFKQDEIKPEMDLVEIYTGEIGVREKTGKNDGKDVEKYLKATGLGKGHPWCSAFVKWCFDEAGIVTNITAYSPSAYDKRKVVYKGEWKKDFRPGQVFTIYYQNLGRIGHTGFVDRKINDKVVETVEGNTNGEGSREGNGVYKKKRSLHSLYAICEFRP